MNPIIQCTDNFFKNFKQVQEDAYAGEFKDFTLGVDGVTYPYICTEVPSSIEFEFLYRLEHLLGARVDSQYLFLRAMPLGVSAPSKAHSDRDMGAFTAHVYLSPFSDLASTVFLKHRDFGTLCTPEMEGLWGQTKAEWSTYLEFIGAPNRLLVHRADAFHQAKPETGFGTMQEKTARLMLTCFFNVQ